MAGRQGRWRGFFHELGKNRSAYLMALPGIILFIVFSYIPMAGLIMAFKDLDFSLGFLKSPWVGLKNFEFLLKSRDLLRITRNTLVLNMLFIGPGLVFDVAVAILLNEIWNKYFKGISQSFLFLPYFLSWVVVDVIARGFLGSNAGMINHILAKVGIPAVNWYGTPGIWPALLFFFNRWKWTGYGSIIYLSAITSMNPELFESAAIDGANRWQRIRYITVPLLKPIIAVMLLLQIGRIFFSDFAMIYGLIGDNGVLYRYTDTIDVYVFRALRILGDMGMSAAAAFYQSAMGFIIIMLSNYWVRRVSPENALF